MNNAEKAVSHGPAVAPAIKPQILPKKEIPRHRTLLRDPADVAKPAQN